MKKSVLLFVATFPLILSGCAQKNGTEKVNYSVFHREAVSASEAKAPKVNSVTINGWTQSKSTKYTANNLVITETTDYATLSISDLAFVYLVAQYKGAPASINEASNTEYFVGNGFRIVGSGSEGEGEVAWDEYLNLTYMRLSSTDSSCDVSVAYTY